MSLGTFPKPLLKYLLRDPKDKRNLGGPPNCSGLHKSQLISINMPCCCEQHWPREWLVFQWLVIADRSRGRPNPA